MAVTYVRGDRKLITYPVTAATTFAKGELLAVVSNAVKSFTTLPDVGTKAQNQAAARDLFAGVANVAVTSGSPTSIQVATAGTFTFDCASATFNVGDMVTPIGTGAADAVGVSATSVEVTTNPGLAIGRVVKKYASATTRVQVEISAVHMARPMDDVTVADTISENTSTAGVVIDGVRLKDGGVWVPQGAPDAQSGTSFTVTAARILGGLITSTNAAAVTATLDTGTAMDTAITSIVGTDTCFDWSIINLGSASGACTVTAASGHTVVGNMVVAISTTGRFRSRRTAANTWITYRLS